MKTNLLSLVFMGCVVSGALLGIVHENYPATIWAACCGGMAWQQAKMARALYLTEALAEGLMRALLEKVRDEAEEEA